MTVKNIGFILRYFADIQELVVIPANAGIQGIIEPSLHWIPVSTGMTVKGIGFILRYFADIQELFVIPADAGIQGIIEPSLFWIPVSTGQSRANDVHLISYRQESPETPGGLL